MKTTTRIVTPNPQPYPPGEEPGHDTLPDGRKVAVRTAWHQFGGWPMHYDHDDVDPSYPAGPATMALEERGFDERSWTAWRGGMTIASDVSEPAAVRALVGLPMEEP